MTSRWTVTGVVCLVGASVGALVQYLVTPISEGDSAFGAGRSRRRAPDPDALGGRP